MMIRGFEVVSAKKDLGVKLPERSTKNSAGYDFFAYEDVTIPSSIIEWTTNRLKSGKNGIAPTLVKTGVKAYMQEDELLCLYNRSSNPKKLGLILGNSVGVVDSDYYNNPENEGEIGFLFYNIFLSPVTIKKGEKIGQGIFSKFLKADGDVAAGDRTGGFGSTGK